MLIPMPETFFSSLPTWLITTCPLNLNAKIPSSAIFSWPTCQIPVFWPFILWTYNITEQLFSDSGASCMHLFPVTYSVIPYWHLEIDYGRSIYTMEIDKIHKPVIWLSLFPTLQRAGHLTVPSTTPLITKVFFTLGFIIVLFIHLCVL